jgi:HSP20 family molecular chaperone IbpA
MSEITKTQQKGRVEEARPEATRGGACFVPRVDIFETDDGLVLQADVPGVRAEDVDLHYERGELTLFARVRRRLPQCEFLLQEYEEGDFYRVFTVHESIDASRIEAQCKNGVLTVHLPKMESVRPRQIKVSAQ